jgi:4,5-DOPA dioxygenase extradiol
MSSRAPALFLGHGSPLNVITENPFVPAWAALGQRFAKPKGIVSVSAHWETEGPAVTTSERPRTIHDFYGFPPALYQIRYDAPGSPELAARVAALTGARGDADWGFDHGTWGVLGSVYPKADVPVIQLSLDKRASPEEHYRLGGTLAPLRDEGVMILGSGNIVHNLRFFRGGASHYDWARDFNEAVKAKVTARDHTALFDYASLSKGAALAVPTAEHYLPLLYVLAAQGETEQPEILTDEVLGSIAMTSVLLREGSEDVLAIELRRQQQRAGGSEGEGLGIVVEIERD